MRGNIPKYLHLKPGLWWRASGHEYTLGLTPFTPLMADEHLKPLTCAERKHFPSHFLSSLDLTASLVAVQLFEEFRRSFSGQRYDSGKNYKPPSYSICPLPVCALGKAAPLKSRSKLIRSNHTASPGRGRENPERGLTYKRVITLQSRTVITLQSNYVNP